MKSHPNVRNFVHLLFSTNSLRRFNMLDVKSSNRKCHCSASGVKNPLHISFFL